MIFPRCNAIHTCFMRFPIDVVFLTTALENAECGIRSAECTIHNPQSTIHIRQRTPTSSVESVQGTVVWIAERVTPFRFLRAGRADMVIELPAGVVARTRTHAGHRIWAGTVEVDE